MNKNNLLIISLISLVLFIVLLFSINFIFPIDQLVNSSITGIQTPVWVDISKIISIIFEPVYIIAASVIISLIIFFRSRKQALFFGLTMLASGAIGYALKEIVQRARPENALILESSFSFPSGHALFSLVIVGFVIYHLISKIKSKAGRAIFDILLTLMVLIIGFSRIYLNVHWASDVFGGFLLGLFIFFLSLAIRKIF